MKTSRGSVVWRWAAAGFLAGVWAAIAFPLPARAASSRDYPGPCAGETNAVGVPLYLAADYHGLNPAFGVIVLGQTGRFRLGISCVATGFAVIRVGPDSALCTLRGRCTPEQIAGLTREDVEAVEGIPDQVPFGIHECIKHGFGWYDAVNVPAGIYLAIAQSKGPGGFIWWGPLPIPVLGFVDGHGTMDTYAFAGNGGAYQAVNCPRPPVCGNWIVEPGEQCDDGNTVGGDCCSPTCAAEPAGSSCPGSGDLCTPGTCNGGGACLHQNACVDEPIDGVKLQLERRNGKEKLLWIARRKGGQELAGGGADPTVSGATLELYSPADGPVAMPLPAAGWTARGAGVFKFRNGNAPGGISPVRAAMVSRGQKVKVTARSAGFSLATPLRGVGIRLVAGTLATCSFFPASTVVTSEAGRFEARGPGAVAERCDRFTLAQGVPGGDPSPGIPPEYPDPDPGPGPCTGLELCPILE